jgi:hypothetical protein
MGTVMTDKSVDFFLIITNRQAQLAIFTNSIDPICIFEKKFCRMVWKVFIVRQYNSRVMNVFIWTLRIMNTILL